MTSMKKPRHTSHIWAVPARLPVAVFSALMLGALTVLLVVPALAAGSGTWSLTGGMHTARAGQTATLLSNGQVLVVGGFSDYYGNTTLASAELYNPATGEWTVTGSMSDARSDHTATLLSNGQVLVTGGCCSSSDILASAELYNPAAGKWTTTGSMSIGRAAHTATLLQNGQVLVAGGFTDDCSNCTTLASAELYNPATGTWTTTGSMSIARQSDTATLLSNGQVLVAGGRTNNTSILASAELYNPTAGKWMTTGTMHAARVVQTATLLSNGQVLVAGGVGTSSIPLASTELYTP